MLIFDYGILIFQLPHGIFLPLLLFVAFLNPLVGKMRNSKLASAFLDAVNVASVSIIAAICIKLGKETVTDWRTISIAVTTIIMAFGFKKINSALLVLTGEGLGYLLSLL